MKRYRTRTTPTNSDADNVMDIDEIGPVISYATHPSIIHRIARYACPSLKLSFRATSRTFRRLLDPGIFQHVVLTGGPDAEQLRSPEGCLPGIPWAMNLNGQLGPDTWGMRLPYVRVLDVDSPPGQGFDRWSHDMTSVQVVRGSRDVARHGLPPFGGNHAPFTQAVLTMVDAVHLCREPQDILGPTSAMCSKHVYNILFDPYNEHTPMLHLSFVRNDVPPDVVFVFTPHYCSGSAGKRVARAHNIYCGFLRDLLDAIWGSGNAERITLVGLADLDRHLLGLDRGTPTEELEEVMRQAFRTIAFQSPMAHENEVLDFYGKLRFKSKAEYRRAVGDRQYALETGYTGLAEPRHPVTLDPASYPHILDRVISTAPWQSLLKLRTMSRAFKDRVDRRIFGHVSVLPGSLPYLLFVRGLTGTLLGVKALDANCLDRLVDDKYLPFFKLTRVLEVPRELDAGIAKMVYQLLPNLEVVRNLTTKPPTITTTPLTQVLSSSEARFSPLQYLEKFDRTGTPMDCTSFSTNAGCERLVVNHLYDAAAVTSSELPCVTRSRKQPAEVVLVFTPFRFPRSARGKAAAEFLDDLATYIIDAVRRRRVGRAASRLTLVGVWEMVAACLAAEPGAQHPLLDADSMADGSLATALFTDAWRGRDTEWKDPELGETRDNLRFVSLRQYLHEGGERAYWETVVPPLEVLYAAGWAPKAAARGVAR